MTQLFDSFLTVGQQVLGLFVLVCVGVICGKKRDPDPIRRARLRRACPVVCHPLRDPAIF